MAGSAQALVAFRGNRYPVPPRQAGATVLVSHRLGEQVLDIATPGGTVLARHRREPDSAGALVRDTVHVTALETAVLAASTAASPAPARSDGHRRRWRWPRPKQPRGSQRTEEREVVVDLARYAQAARDRQEIAR